MIRCLGILGLAGIACGLRSPRTERHDCDAAPDCLVHDAYRTKDASVPDSIPTVYCDLSEYQALPSGASGECPATRPFCCVTGVDFITTCEQIYVASEDCKEHPSTATQMSCDPKDGTGCDSAKPICCADYDPMGKLVTYCSDHVLQGGWMCSQ